MPARCVFLYCNDEIKENKQEKITHKFKGEKKTQKFNQKSGSKNQQTTLIEQNHWDDCVCVCSTIEAHKKRTTRNLFT